MQDDHLKRIPDLSRLAKRFQRATATLQDVVRLYQVVLRLPALVSALQQPSVAECLQGTFGAPLQVPRVACAIRSRETARTRPPLTCAPQRSVRVWLNTPGDHSARSWTSTSFSKWSRPPLTWPRPSNTSLSSRPILTSAYEASVFSGGSASRKGSCPDPARELR